MSEDEHNRSWERKKQFYIRSLFQDQSDFASISEEFYSSESYSTSPPQRRSLSSRSYRSPSPFSRSIPRSPYHRRNPRTSPQSPGRYCYLPPLIIEREPNKHDEPEEYYIRLENNVKKMYRKWCLKEDTSSVSSVGDKFAMVNEEIDDDAEVTDDRHSTIEEHDEEINDDHSPNEHEVTDESDNRKTIDEELDDNDDLSNDGPYTEDRVEQNADHLLQDDVQDYGEVVDNRHSPKEVTVDHVSLNRQNEDNYVFVNLEVNRVSDAAHHIEVMRTPRHQSPCSPQAVNPSRSLENNPHFDHEPKIPESDQSNTFDVLRLSSPKNYLEYTNTDFDNLREDSSDTNCGNMGERYRNILNDNLFIGSPTVFDNLREDSSDSNCGNMGERYRNILNDNFFIGSPKVYKLCSCMNHVCGT